jgi:hypothetical protein
MNLGAYGQKPAGEKQSLHNIGAEMGLMNYFSLVFDCSGFVSIGRI